MDQVKLTYFVKGGHTSNPFMDTYCLRKVDRRTVELILPGDDKIEWFDHLRILNIYNALPFAFPEKVWESAVITVNDNSAKITREGDHHKVKLAEGTSSTKNFVLRVVLREEFAFDGRSFVFTSDEHLKLLRRVEGQKYEVEREISGSVFYSHLDNTFLVQLKTEGVPISSGLVLEISDFQIEGSWVSKETIGIRQARVGGVEKELIVVKDHGWFDNWWTRFHYHFSEEVKPLRGESWINVLLMGVSPSLPPRGSELIGAHPHALLDFKETLSYVFTNDALASYKDESALCRIALNRRGFALTIQGDGGGMFNRIRLRGFIRIAGRLIDKVIGTPMVVTVNGNRAALTRDGYDVMIKLVEVQQRKSEVIVKVALHEDFTFDGYSFSSKRFPAQKLKLLRKEGASYKVAGEFVATPFYCYMHNVFLLQVKDAGVDSFSGAQAGDVLELPDLSQVSYGEGDAPRRARVDGVEKRLLVNAPDENAPYKRYHYHFDRESPKGKWLNVCLLGGENLWGKGLTSIQHDSSISLPFIIIRRVFFGNTSTNAPTDYTSPSKWYLHPDRETTVQYTEVNLKSNTARYRSLTMNDRKAHRSIAICYLHGTVGGNEPVVSEYSSLAMEHVVRAFLGIQCHDKCKLYAPVLRAATFNIGELFKEDQDTQKNAARNLLSDVQDSIVKFIDSEKESDRRIIVCNSQTSIILNIALALNLVPPRENVEIYLSGCFSEDFFKVFKEDARRNIENQMGRSSFFAPIDTVLEDTIGTLLPRKTVVSLAKNEDSRYVHASSVFPKSEPKCLCLPSPYASEMDGLEGVFKKHISDWPHASSPYIVVVDDEPLLRYTMKNGLLFATPRLKSPISELNARLKQLNEQLGDAPDLKGLGLRPEWLSRHGLDSLVATDVAVNARQSLPSPLNFKERHLSRLTLGAQRNVQC